MKSYTITSAGSLESTMATLRIPVRVTEYPSVQATMRDIAMVLQGSTEEILAEMVSVRADDGHYVYESQEAADRDQDGSRAIAIIERKVAAEVAS